MAGSFAPITGDDLEDIIEENGGTGEWENPSTDAEPVERWEFPRFAGATDKADMYLSRVGLGPYDTDVETICGWLDAPRNVVGAVLLLGDPGCGKTALIEAAVTHSERDMTTMLFTPDHTKDSLLLRFVGENKGACIRSDHDHTDDMDDLTPDCVRTPFVLGPLAYAAKHGRVFYGDEVMLLPDGVKPILYSLADGRRFLPEGNIDGSPLEIHPDFRMVLSSNPMVRGASIPEPLSSRCASTTITIVTTVDMLHDLGIDDSVVAAWEAIQSAGMTWLPQIREVRLADYWLNVDPTQACSAFLPEHCPESQREQIRNIVVSYLGGNLSTSGRLVVS
jgi:hypothetical protein